VTLRPIVRALIVPVLGIESVRGLSDDERALLAHVLHFGSAGYPVKKLGRGWTWSFRSIAGPPVVFRTKRQAVASFEQFLDVLRSAEREDANARALAAGEGQS